MIINFTYQMIVNQGENSMEKKYFISEDTLMYMRGLLNDMECTCSLFCEECPNYKEQECPYCIKDLILEELDGIEEDVCGE